MHADSFLHLLPPPPTINPAIICRTAAAAATGHVPPLAIYVHWFTAEARPLFCFLFRFFLLFFFLLLESNSYRNVTPWKSFINSLANRLPFLLYELPLSPVYIMRVLSRESESKLSQCKQTLIFYTLTKCVVRVLHSHSRTIM